VIRARPNEKIARPVRPNAGLEALYRRRLYALIEDMHRSIEHWLTAAYRRNQPLIAQDDAPLPKPLLEARYVGGVRPWLAVVDGEPMRNKSGAAIRFKTEVTATLAARRFIGDILPASELQAVMDDLAEHWTSRFDVMAERMGRYFARAAASRTEGQMRAILRDAGWTVKMRMSPAVRDVVEASVRENVGLIKSIPQQHLKEVQGLVMRSVQRGRDLSTLAKDLRKRYGVTKRRAALIARDQNNKATSAFQEARRIELGIKEAVWMHSHAGKKPRPTHVAMDGKRYKVDEGMYDSAEGEYVWPGQLINCFPAGTRIEHALLVEKAYRHWCRSDLAKIITSTGKTLSATVNHPILTPSGWKPIGSLDEGDDVVEVAEKRIRGSMVKNYIDQAVPTICQIFAALDEAPRSESRVSLGGHFHGDVADGDVDIVSSAWPLNFGIEKLEGLQQFGLSYSNYSTSSQSFFSHLATRCFRSTPHFIGRLGKHFSLVFGGLLHSQEHAFASIPNMTTSLLDPVFYDRTLMSGLMMQREDAFPGHVLSVQVARIVKVERREFSGHVYNLQTNHGWYVAGGIIAHNCRCVSRAILPGF